MCQFKRQYAHGRAQDVQHSLRLNADIKVGIVELAPEK